MRLESVQLSSRSLAPPTGALQWLDQKSRPAAHTHGDLPEASYIQAAIGGAVEGLAMGGFSGALSASLASTVGIWTERRTGNSVAGMAAGIAVGAALGAGVAYLTNQPDMVSRSVAGGLLGCFATLGGAATASVRDSSDMGAVASGFFLPGASKATGGVASALASRYGADLHPAARAALGAGLGAGLAVAFGALGASPVPPAFLVASSALGGGVGPLLGPRFGQLIRNVSHDLGGAMESGARQAGILKKPLSPAVAGCLGALPAGLLSEFGKSYVFSDGSLLGLAIGGVAQTIQLVDIFTNSKPDDEDEVYATVP